MPRPARHQKVTQEQYFEAALARLAAHGVDGLTIGGLCSELGVTSGSFYHYFGSWAGFVAALLAHWEAEQTQRIVDQARAVVDPEIRLDLLRDQASGLPHNAEAAIRAWSQADEVVGQAQRRVDAMRRGQLREAVLGMGVPVERAERLATMGLALLVGLQQLERPVDEVALRAVFDEFGTLVADQAKRVGHV
ncbi:MAG TPA: TetR/AcrR family transcriptional regulator [Pseudonocardia sp.]|nr:TetR/AcrR family transcriptional regulator [Pseudonocardia sp.]